MKTPHRDLVNRHPSQLTDDELFQSLQLPTPSGKTLEDTLACAEYLKQMGLVFEEAKQRTKLIERVGSDKFVEMFTAFEALANNFCNQTNEMLCRVKEQRNKQT